MPDSIGSLFFPPEERPSAEVDFSDLTWEQAVENFDNLFDPQITNALALAGN